MLIEISKLMVKKLKNKYNIQDLSYRKPIHKAYIYYISI